ncbi:hypothetical protein Efla_003954 [Eimeria flavescens]
MPVEAPRKQQQQQQQQHQHRTRQQQQQQQQQLLSSNYRSGIALSRCYRATGADVSCLPCSSSSSSKSSNSSSKSSSSSSSSSKSSSNHSGSSSSSRGCFALLVGVTCRWLSAQQQQQQQTPLAAEGLLLAVGGSLQGPVSHCCFLPHPRLNSSSSSEEAAAAEAAEAAEDGSEDEQGSSSLEALLSSSSSQRRQQQQQRQRQKVSSSCLLAEGTRVFLGSWQDTPETQKFVSAKSPVTALAARSDGALCCVGEESGLLSVFSVANRKALRRFQPSSKSFVRCCCFGGERHSLFAAGDDCVVRQWSLETGALSVELQGHLDSVRGVCCLPGLPFLAASASYDATAKLWDARTGKACLTLPQGDPTECVRLWDVRQPREAAWSLSSFAKTVFAVREFPAAAAVSAAAAASAAPAAEEEAAAEGGEEGSGLLLAAASLDNVVRIYSCDTLQLLQCFSVRSDMLCLDVATGSSRSSSKGNKGSSSSSRQSSCRLLMGLSDGGWILRHAAAAPPASEELLLLQQQRQQQQQRKRLLLLRPTDGGYFKRGRTAPANPGDVVVDSLEARRLSRLDRLIKSFQYQAALDVALATTPEHVIALTSELLQRGGLHAAVRGRDAASLLSLLQFAAKHAAFRAPSETAVVLQLLDALMCENEEWILESLGETQQVAELIKKICQRVAFELEQIHRLARVEAMVDALLAV